MDIYLVEDILNNRCVEIDGAYISRNLAIERVRELNKQDYPDLTEYLMFQSPSTPGWKVSGAITVKDFKEE